MHIDALVRVPPRNVIRMRQLLNRPAPLSLSMGHKPHHITHHNLIIDITRTEKTPSDLLRPVCLNRDIIRKAEIAIDKGLASWYYTRPNIILHTIERPLNSSPIADDITSHFIKKGFTVFDYDETPNIITFDIYKDIDRIAGYLKEGRMPEFARSLTI